MDEIVDRSSRWRRSDSFGFSWNSNREKLAAKLIRKVICNDGVKPNLSSLTWTGVNAYDPQYVYIGMKSVFRNLSLFTLDWSQGLRFSVFLRWTEVSVYDPQFVYIGLVSMIRTLDLFMRGAHGLFKIVCAIKLFGTLVSDEIPIADRFSPSRLRPTHGCRGRLKPVWSPTRWPNWFQIRFQIRPGIFWYDRLRKLSLRLNFSSSNLVDDGYPHTDTEFMMWDLNSSQRRIWAYLCAPLHKRLEWMFTWSLAYILILDGQHVSVTWRVKLRKPDGISREMARKKSNRQPAFMEETSNDFICNAMSSLM